MAAGAMEAGDAAVLVVRRGGLGDTLLMLPVLRALRQQAPRQALHFAGDAAHAAVLAAFAVVDRVLSSELLQSWALAIGGERAAAARQRLSRYRRIVADSDELLAVAGPGVEVRCFDPRPRDDRPLSRQLLRQLGLPVVVDADRLAPPGKRGAVVVLAPGSGGREKCWPAARFVELAHALAGMGRPVQVVVGPVEQERDDPRSWSWPRGSGFLFDLDTVGLARALQAAAAFVGNDSGVTHLAAALGVPTIAVFGPTDPEVWAPIGTHVQVVGRRTQGPPAVAVDVVIAAVQRAFA